MPRMPAFLDKPAHVDLPADFPAQAVGLLRSLAEARDYETAVALSNFVAAFVHPDYVCNLADLRHLPDDAKQAAREFFAFCLHDGLTLQEQGQILLWVQPYLQRAVGARISH